MAGILSLASGPLGISGPWSSVPGFLVRAWSVPCPSRLVPGPSCLVPAPSPFLPGPSVWDKLALSMRARDMRACDTPA